MKKHELLSLENIGKAMLADLQLLGIQSISELSVQNPDDLYERLCKLTGIKHDPCVWDTFAAAIHEARTGEKTKWWKWTALRKKHFKKIGSNFSKS